VLSRFVDQLLPDAIDSLGILPADWDRWPPRAAAPFKRRVTQSRWMSKGKDDHFEWMSEESDRSAAVARQREMMDRVDRALRESPLFQALRAGDLVIEAKRRDDRGRYSEVEILSPEVWQFERLNIIQKSPPLLFQKAGKDEWARFAHPIVRLSQRTTAETAAQQEGPRSRTKAPRKEPAYKIMRRKKAELVGQGKIPREMPEGKQFDLVMRALPPGKGRGFTIDNFEQRVADWWPSDSDF
jgi:hypothetical protein